MVLMLVLTTESRPETAGPDSDCLQHKYGLKHTFDDITLGSDF